MSFPVVFHIPGIVRSVPAASVPAQVAFPRTGLLEEERSDKTGDERAKAAEAFFCSRLPLSPSEAKSVLAEMLHLGNARAQDGSLLQQTLVEYLFPAPGAGQSREERAALEAFAKDGNVAGEPAAAPWAGVSAEHMRHALIDCQKTLLLARELEVRRAEMLYARERARQGEERLLRALHGDEDDGPFAVLPESGVEFTDAEYERPLPWRAVLDAALAFTPADAIFFTTDPDMAGELRDMGMLQPFPEDRADVCSGWPQDVVNGLLLANLPAWRLVGRRFLPPERPWLARDLEVFVARPQGGWRQGEGTRNQAKAAR